MKSEQEFIDKHVLNLRALWNQCNGNKEAFFKEVAFFIAIRDVELQEFKQRDLELWKEQKKEKKSKVIESLEDKVSDSLKPKGSFRSEEYLFGE